LVKEIWKMLDTLLPSWKLATHTSILKIADLFNWIKPRVSRDSGPLIPFWSCLLMSNKLVHTGCVSEKVTWTIPCALQS
jgi:hypothetical protein